VLDSASNTAALDTVHIGSGNHTGEEWVLREAFEALQDGEFDAKAGRLQTITLPPSGFYMSVVRL
jgi:hypothetical protein